MIDQAVAILRGVATRSSRADAVEPSLLEAWGLVMDVILEQRFRWGEVATLLGISQGGVRALLALDGEHPPSMGELAVIMSCDPSYITAVVDDLEGAGLAHREPSENDRRVKVVSLTSDGVLALRTVRDRLLATPPGFAGLDPKDQRQLARLLQRGLGTGRTAE